MSDHNVLIEEYQGTFWNERIWLPPNVTWAHLVNGNGQPGVNYRVFSDLLYPIPAAIVVIFARFWVERLVFRPFGLYLGLRKSRHVPPPTNDVLEAAFRQSTKNKKTSRLSEDEIVTLANKCDMSIRQVERWFRKRRLQNRPNMLEKFSETGWRWLYYTIMFVYGVYVLWSKPWTWDIKYCWYQYPHHSIEPDVWWYYMIELSFYWSLCISQFFDVKRKDFFEMFIHHVTTIALMGFSWTCNLTRVGSLVLIVHDVADIFLEAAKMCIYTKYKKLSDAIFLCFALTWVATRLGLYPTWILYSTTIEAPQLVQMFPAYYIFNFLLSILLVLHVIWTYYIFKIAYKAIQSGETEDARSDSEDETLSSTNEEESLQETLNENGLKKSE